MLPFFVWLIVPITVFISQQCGVIVRQSGSFIFRFGWRGVGSSAMDLRERLGSRLKGLMRARTPQLWLLGHCTWDGHPRTLQVFGNSKFESNVQRETVKYLEL